MQDPSDIYFWGPWTPDERARIADAVRTFDRIRGLGNPLPGHSRAWIAVMHDLADSGRYCFASRIGISASFTGTSTDDLYASIVEAANDPTEDT